MAHLQVTIDTNKLKDLFASDEGMAMLAEEVLNQVLEAQMTDHLQAEPYERTEKRRAYRNGYKSRKLTTRVGKLTLRVPQARDGSFSTNLFRRYQRSEQALVLATGGDGPAGCLNAQSEEDYRGTVRGDFLQEHR